MWRRHLNSVSSPTTTHCRLKQTADVTNTQVGAWMKDKCAVKMGKRSVYKGSRPHKGRGEKLFVWTKHLSIKPLRTKEISYQTLFFNLSYYFSLYEPLLNPNPAQLFNPFSINLLLGTSWAHSTESWYRAQRNCTLQLGNIPSTSLKVWANIY